MSCRRFEGKRVIVTGGARGVGARVVDDLVSERALVAVIDVQADAALKRHAHWGSSVLISEADLRSPDACASAVQHAIELLGGVDVLINNAGVTCRDTFADTTADAFWQSIESNLASTFFCTQAAQEALRESRGCVVNVASINSICGNDRLASYSASKAGVVGLTRALAIELASAGIRVNAVSPGTISTPMTDEYLSSLGPMRHDTLQEMTLKHPLGRIATDEEVSGPILFLASDAANFITGVNLPVDGGRSIR